jgi:hypothetical protein
MYATSPDNNNGLFLAVFEGRLIIAGLVDSQGVHALHALTGWQDGYEHIAAAFNITNKIRELLFGLGAITRVDFISRYVDIVAQDQKRRIQTRVKYALDSRSSAASQGRTYTHARGLRKFLSPFLDATFFWFDLNSSPFFHHPPSPILFLTGQEVAAGVKAVGKERQLEI